MRSSKSRSRSKTNRPRTLGNIINRVFESSGPEGKVRGTPQQIIEKYQMLTRDAQLSNDRVAAENFSQHAEHYTRMLAEATREMAAEQETRQQQFQPHGSQNSGQGGGQNGGQGGGQNNGQNSGQNGGQNGGQAGQGNPRYDRQGDYRDRERNERDRNTDRQSDRPADRQSDRPADRPERGDYRPEYRSEFREERPVRDFGSEDQPAIVDVIDLGAKDDTGLIETPEARRPVRSASPARSAAPGRSSESAPPEVPTAAEPAAPQGEREGPARRARGPRKPRPEGTSGGNDTPPKEAAE